MKSIPSSTAKSYQSSMKSYEKGMKSIPGAPEPYPLDETKVRGFLIWYKTTHPNTTIGYLKQFVVAFAHYLRSENIPDFTKNAQITSFRINFFFIKSLLEIYKMRIIF